MGNLDWTVEVATYLEEAIEALTTSIASWAPLAFADDSCAAVRWTALSWSPGTLAVPRFGSPTFVVVGDVGRRSQSLERRGIEPRR